MASTYERLLDRMRRLCSMREYCSSDIRDKVMTALRREREKGNMQEDRGANQDAETAGEILESLRRDGYLDDRRYAAAFARDKSSIAGWGAIKIRHSLMMKGIGEDTVREALCSLDEERSRQRMEKVIAVKRASLKDTPDLRLRLIRFAAGRGYPYDDAVSAIDRILHNKTTDK